MATEPVSSTQLKHPVPNVVIFETSTEPCNEKKDCIRDVRHLQNNHMEGKGYTDIIYNFLVGADGNAYYGRGWDTESLIAPNCNQHAISIAFIGSFSQQPPPRAQIIAAKRLISKGIRKGYISTECRMVAASQLMGGNEGTGKMLLEEIKKWPNWASTVNSKDITTKEMFCIGN